MRIYFDKAGLYREIVKIKNKYGLDETTYSIQLIEYCKRIGILLEMLPYKTNGLRGMAVLGEKNKQDIILLTKGRNEYEHNFDCGHELIHLNVHRNAGLKSFNCFDNVKACQNPFYEWHANEGAAEFLVPYKVLLPILKEYRDYLNDYDNITAIKKELSDMFMVPTSVIKYRFDNLKYEIHQYLKGTSINDIRLLSLNQQNKLRINTLSINDIADRDFNHIFIDSFY